MWGCISGFRELLVSISVLRRYLQMPTLMSPRNPSSFLRMARLLAHTLLTKRDQSHDVALLCLHPRPKPITIDHRCSPLVPKTILLAFEPGKFPSVAFRHNRHNRMITCSSSIPVPDDISRKMGAASTPNLKEQEVQLIVILGRTPGCSLRKFS